jgi:hypothetical protein
MTVNLQETIIVSVMQVLRVDLILSFFFLKIW